MYKKYQQETKRLEADPDKPKGTFGNIVRSVSKGLIKEAEKVPGVELASNFIDKDGLSNALGDWADFVAKKISNKDEVELILQPKKVLSPLFWKDISKVAPKKTALCFFIDTFEESNSILETWLLECLEEIHGAIPANSQFVIAGRDELNPNRWSAYNYLTQTISLEPFTDTEIELFFANYSIVDDAIKADIRRLTNGLPVLMAWLCEAAKTGKGILQDVADTAVERFLKWVVDDKQRTIALEAALARRINQDIIECLLHDASESKAYFDWLIKQPFTLKRSDAWAYHNVVREQMMRFIRTKSPKQWAACHEKLSTYYQNLQNDLALKEEDTFLHDKWLAYEAERLYHALCAKPDKNIAQGIENFVTLMDNNGWNKAEIFGEILKEAGENTEHKLCKGWGLRVITAIEESRKDNELPLEQLCEDILEKNLVNNNNNKGFLYYIIGWINYSVYKNYEKAIKQYQKAIEIQPNHANAYFQLGNVYIQNEQNIDYAIENFLKAIEIQPNHANAYYCLGLIYSIKEQDNDLIIKYFLIAIELNPDFADAYFQLGKIYAQNEQNYDFAIKNFLIAIKLNPDFVEAYYILGLIYSIKNQDDNLVIKYFQRAIEAKPDFADAYFQLGKIYAQNEQNYDFAIKNLLIAIELKPDYAEAYFHLGNVYTQKKQYYDLAIESFQKAIELKPDYTDAYYVLGYIYQIKKIDYDLAIEYFQKVIKLAPSNADAYYSLGLIYQFGKQDYELAIKQYKKGLKLKPAYKDIYIFLGNIYENHKKDYNCAIEHYKKAIELKPNNVTVYDKLGSTYSKLKDYNKAIEYYQKATDIEPNNANFLNSWGFTLLQNGQLGEAEEILIKAIDLGNIEYGNMNLGHIHFVKGKQQEAMACYLKSYAAYENKEAFWEGMQDDFQYLEQYDINTAQYEALLTEVKANIEKV